MAQTRTAELNIQVIGFTDHEGVLHTAVFNESCDEIYFCTFDADGEGLFFESEAYHLPRWCKDHGFTVYRGEIELEVELERQ